MADLAVLPWACTDAFRALTQRLAPLIVDGRWPEARQQLAAEAIDVPAGDAWLAVTSRVFGLGVFDVARAVPAMEMLTLETPGTSYAHIAGDKVRLEGVDNGTLSGPAASWLVGADAAGANVLIVGASGTTTVQRALLAALSPEQARRHPRTLVTRAVEPFPPDRVSRVVVHAYTAETPLRSSNILEEVLGTAAGGIVACIAPAPAQGIRAMARGRGSIVTMPARTADDLSIRPSRMSDSSIPDCAAHWRMPGSRSPAPVARTCIAQSASWHTASASPST